MEHSGNIKHVQIINIHFGGNIKHVSSSHVEDTPVNFDKISTYFLLEDFEIWPDNGIDKGVGSSFGCFVSSFCILKKSSKIATQ
jgi:hypothetical protein